MQHRNQDDSEWTLPTLDEADEESVGLATPEYCIVNAIALLTQAQQTMKDLERFLSHNNVNGAAGALGLAITYHKVASHCIMETKHLLADHPQDQNLQLQCDQLLSQLNALEHSYTAQMPIIAARAKYQHHNEQAEMWYAHCLQTDHCLVAFKHLQDTLEMDHTNDDAWNDKFRSAYIETMEQLVDQPDVAPVSDEDIDQVLKRPDGFTQHKHQLQQNAEQAQQTIKTMLADVQERYNQTLPVVVSSTMKRFPNLTKGLRAKVIPVTLATSGFYCGQEAISHLIAGVLDDTTSLWEESAPLDNNTQDDGFVAYVSYIHEGRKHIQALVDPYPKGFPAEQVLDHMDGALENLESQSQGAFQNHPALSWCRFRETIEARRHTAEIGIHDVKTSDLIELLQTTKRLQIPHGGRIAMMTAISQWDLDVEAMLLKDTVYAEQPMTCRRQASAIIKTARQQGLDNYKLSELAETLGYTAQELGIHLRKMDRQKRSALQQAAQKAGLPETVVDDILFELDPGYIELTTRRERLGTELR